MEQKQHNIFNLIWRRNMKTFTPKNHISTKFISSICGLLILDRNCNQLYTYLYHVWPYNMVIGHYIALFLEPGTGRVNIKEVNASTHVPKANEI